MLASATNFLKFLRKADQLRVPIYQRTYSWTPAECDQLLADIERIADSPGDAAHFLGSVVYVADSDYTVGRDNAVQLIDGQQRITTITLLLLAIEELMREADADDVSARRIRNQLLTRPDEEGDERYKLLLTQQDRSTLIALIDGSPPPDEPSAALLRNFRHFQSVLRAPGAVPARTYRGLDRLMIVDIALTRGNDDPQLIFESLNSTGVDLSQADLIRNYLLMGLRDSEQAKIYRSSWFPMERALGTGEGGSRFDHFMRDYLTLKTGQIPNLANVYRAFKIYYTAQGQPDPAATAADLRKFAGYWSNVAGARHPVPAVRRALEDLSTLAVDVAYPFLIDVLDDRAEGKIDDGELVAVLRIVETYLIRRSLVGLYQTGLNKVFATLAREIDESRYLESLGASLLSRVGSIRMPSDDEFAANLPLRDLYNSRHRGFVLAKLENVGRRERISASDYTIEHVLPQNPNLSQPWREMVGADWQHVQATYLHTLGNLTLTAYNAELSDRPFDEKRMHEGGFARSPLWLNASLAAQTRWDEAAIVERGRLLVRRAIEAWPLPAVPQDVIDAYREAKAVKKTAYGRTDFPNLAGPVGTLFDRLSRAVANLDPDVREEFRKQYVGFRRERIVLSVVPLTDALKVYLRCAPDDYPDAAIELRDVRDIGHWGVGGAEARVVTEADVDEIARLVVADLERDAESSTTNPGWAVAAVDRLIDRFEDADVQTALRRLVEVAVEAGLYPRPYQHALGLVAPANRSRILVSVHARSDRKPRLWVIPDAISELLHLEPSAVEAALDARDGDAVDAGELNDLALALEELLADAPGRGLAQFAPTGRRAERLAYWDGLISHARDVGEDLGRMSARSGSSISKGSGVAGLGWVYAISQHTWSVELYIDRGVDSDAANRAILQSLQSNAVEIERRFGGTIEWDVAEGRRACIVRAGGEGGYRDSGEWEVIVSAQVAAMRRLREALGEYVSEAALVAERAGEPPAV